MRHNTIRVVGITMAAATAMLFVGSEQAVAQTADMAGAWTLSVTTDTGTTTPSLTLEQDGMTLTGTYSSEALGTNAVTGSVEGSEVTVSFTADLQGQSAPVVYHGTVDAEGVWTGTIDIAGGLLTGTFTAKKDM